jgi:protein-tyrosine-phosphatase
MAEAIMRHLGGDLVEVMSAGTIPSEVHPLAVRALQSLRISAGGQRSKHVDEYRDREFDYVITLCDRAREVCPVLPGDPEQRHWSFPDPAAVAGSEAERIEAFVRTAHELQIRIRYLLLLFERDREGRSQRTG